MNRFLLSLAAVGLLAALIASCTGQGEGQRCQSANNNDDCQSGLICGQPKSGSGANYEVCCPAAGVAASDPLCLTAPPTPGSDASITDGATTDTGTNDAAQTDAADGGGTDAADGGADGGDSGDAAGE